jgi:hypothetical protein
MPKYIVNTTISKTYHLDAVFEIEAESQEEARAKVEELGYKKACEEAKLIDESIYDVDILEEYFDVL